MKIQGVEILRITDFCRFFDIEDFLVRREDYASMFRDMDLELFCNNRREAQILTQIRAWCLGMPLNATFADGQLSLPGGGWIPLGPIAEVLNDYRERISYADRVGLAYLFLILKNSWDKGLMRKACEAYVSFCSGMPVGEYLSLHKHTSYTPAPLKCSGVQRRFICNTQHSEPLTVSCGDRSVCLWRGECVVGIFDSEGRCVSLLPRTSVSDDGNIRLTLRLNPSTGTPCVEVFRAKSPDGTEFINDVSSFWIEPGDYIVLCKTDGTMVFDNDCYSLRLSYNKFRKANPDKKILAAEPSEGYYTFYTL